MDSQTIRTALGELQEDPDRKDSWDTLGEAIKQPEGDLDAAETLRLLASARHAHRDRGELDAVAALLALEVEVARGAGDELKAALEQARFLQEDLYDDEGALVAYLRVLELSAEDATANNAVSEIEEKKARWKELAQTYLDEAGSAPDEVYKSSMLMRAAEMELRFAGDDTDWERVLERLLEANRLDPTNDRAARMLELIYRREEKQSELAELLEQVTRRSGDPSNRVSAGVRLARLQKNRFKNEEAAAGAYQGVLREQPSHPEAMSFLSEYYSRSEQWDDLVSLYERGIANADLTSPDSLGDILQIAMLHWRMRGRPTDAEPWFEHIRKINPAFPGMLAFFREYCGQTGDHGRLLGILQAAQRAVSDTEEKQAIAVEIAKLAEEQKDAQRAVEQYKSVLRQDPNNAEARNRLKDLYRKTQGYNALVELLRQELERVDAADSENRLAILREVASVYRQFIKSDTALVSVLNQIVQIKDDDTEAITELITLYERLQRWRDLLGNQQRLAELTADTEVKADLYRQIGRRWLDQFSNVQNATQAFEALLAVKSGDPEAIDRLQELYKKRRAWQSLYDLYQKQLEFAPSSLQVAIMREMAELAAERLRKPEEAAQLYNQILTLDPSNVEVLDAMEKHAERSKDWPTLAQALERRVELLTEDNARLQILQKLGTVYADHISDHHGAVRAWRRVLELSPGHHRALRVLRDSYLASGDYGGLEELYAAQQDWEGLADVLSNTADRAKEQAAKIELSYRAAAVYEERLNQPERAFRSYERILSTDPGDVRAARHLIPLYEKDEKWPRLPSLYELVVEKADDDDDKIQFLSRLIDVVGTRLHDRAAAARYARQAYEIAPEREGTLEQFEEACRAAGTWDIFVEAVESRAKTVKKKKRRNLALKLASVYATELGRIDDAVATYKSLVEADPNDEEASQALEMILRREGRRDDLRWLLGLRTENAYSDDERVRLLREWATLEEEAFDAPENAAKLYQRVLELDPTDTTSLRALPRLLLAAADAAGAAKIIETHRDQAEGAERADLEVQLAELYLGKLGKTADALDAAVRTLDLSEHDARAVAVLQQLLNQEPTRERAAEVLAREYAAVGDARQEAQALQAMLGAAKDPGDRLALYSKLADVHEQKLESYNAALDVTLRAVREFPTDLDMWARAESLAALAGRPSDLAEAYREALRSEMAPEVEVELSARAARLHEERLGDPVGAAPYLERILLRDPSNAPAFGRLKQILTGAERWGELEELYDRTADATDDPSVKADMLAEVALVCEEIIEDQRKATRYYERILKIDPAHEHAMVALDRLYDHQQRYEDLAHLLERRLSTTTAGDTFDMKLRLGRIQLERLHQPAKAIDHIEDVLQERPNDYDARALAERLLEIDDLKIRAARMLESVYEQRNEIRELVRVLQIRLDGLDMIAGTSDDPQLSEEERKELLRRIASLRDERLHDDQGALDALARYVPLDPIDEEARRRLLEIASRLGAQARVAEVLEQAAERAETPTLKGEILMQVARVYEEQLADITRAEAIYRRVLELDASDADLALPAARALERVYVAGGQFDKLADMLRTQIRLEENPETRQALQGRLGALCENELGDLAGAIAAWSARLEENAADGDALVALDRLYERTERWRDLVSILERRQERSENQDERQALMRRAAEVLASKVGEPTEAIDVWRSIVTDFGPSPEAFSALEALYHASERWEDLADTYEAHLDVVDDQDQRLTLLAALGTLRAERLGNTQGALQTYREALTLDTGHGPSRAALERLLESEDTVTRREAAEVLHPIYEADADNQRLLRVLEVEIDAAEDPMDKLEGLEKSIRVADGPLNDENRAFEYARRAVQVAAGHSDLVPWLEEVDRLAGATGRRAEQVSLLREIVGEIFDGDVQFAVTMKIANLAREKLADRDLAREYYQKAIEQRPDDRSAMVALEAIYTESDDVANLLQILERRVEATEDSTEKKALLFRRARLLDDRLADKPRAIEVYETLLDIDVDRDAIVALEKLYADEQRWEDLIRLYQRELEAPGASRADLHVKIATVASRHLKEPVRAFDEIEAALEIDRQHPGAIAELERVLASETDPEHRGRAASLLEPIYLIRADYDQVMNTIQARLDSVDAPEERRELLTRLAHLYEEQKEDYSAALETVAKLLHEDLSDETTISELERLAKVAGAERRLAEIYAAELSQVEVDEQATASLARRTGQLYAALGDHEEALRYYRRALKFDPENQQLFDAVDALLKQTNRHEDRVELYKAGLDYKYEPKDRVRYLHTIAKLQREQLESPDEAIETYRSALDADETDPVVLDALTELYRQRHRYTDLAELFTRRAEGAASPQAAAEHRLALARLLRNELSNTERAIDQLEEIVRAQPNQKEAVSELESLKGEEAYRERIVEILRPLYEEADDWRRVIKLNEDRFDLATDPTEKVSVLRETAQLWEQRGGNVDRARRALAVAFELDPDDSDVRTEYERLVESTESWDELAELYEHVLREHPDLTSKRDILAKLASVHDVRRDDPRRALEAYERLRALDENDVETLEKIEQLATLLSDWTVVVRVLTARADLVLGDDERASIWRQVGEARRDMLEDNEGAIDAFEKAAELDPESAPTLDKMIDLYETKNSPERLVELYQRRVELCRDEEADLRYTLLVKAAEVYEKQLDDKSHAIEMLTQALSVRPGDREVLSALNRLYRAQQMWPELLENLRLEATSADTQEDRTLLRREIAEILADKLESYDEALQAYQLVLDETPGDAQAIAAVRKIGQEHEDLRSMTASILVPVLGTSGKHDDLADVLEMRLTTETDPTARAATLRSLAETLEKQLNRPKDAQAALLRALTEQPEGADLHAEIERLSDASDGWERYAVALSERAQATFDADVAKDLYSRLGRAAEYKLRDDKRAVDAYMRAVEQAGDRPELLEALDRLYGRLGNSQALCEILERRIAIVQTDAERAELHYRIAVVQITEFKDKSRGLSELRAAIETVPGHEGALEELEGLTDDRDLFEEVAEILEGVYRSQGKNDRLAALYEKRVGFAQSAEERIDMRRNLARVLEEDAKDAGAAQRVLQQGFADDPNNASLIEEVERLANMTGNWDGAAGALRDAIDKKVDLTPETARDLSVRVATWYRDRASNSEAAEQALFKALEFEPNNDDVLIQIEQLQSAAGREKDLVQTLRRRAKLQLDDARREELYRKAKELAQSQSDAGLAEEVLRELLSQDDMNTWALSELSDLRAAAGDYKETFALLLKRVQLSTDEAQTRELRHQAAIIAREKLNDDIKAIELYEELFENDPKDSAAANALRELYVKTEQHEDLARLLEKLVDVAQDADTRGGLRMELAKLRQERFNDADAAIALLRVVLEEEPSRSDAVVSLSQLYEASGRNEDLAELLDAQIRSARDRGDAEAELKFQVRLGEIYEGKMGDRTRAIETYQSVLDRNPQHRGALDALARLYQADKNHEQAAQILERLAEMSRGQEALMLSIVLADEYKALKDSERAATALERGLAVDPRNEMIRRRLRDLYAASEAWGKLADLIAGDADALDNIEEKIKLLREAATIHAEKRKDFASAAAVLEKATELKPEDRDLMLELCDAYSASGRGKDAVLVLEKIVEAYGGKRSKELGEIHRRLARAYLADNDTTRAMEELDKAFRIEPGNIQVLKELGEVALQTGDLKKAQQMFRALLLQKLDDKGPITKAEVFMHLGDVHTRLGEKDKAVQMLERAIQTDPSLERAKELLAQVKG